MEEIKCLITTKTGKAIKCIPEILNRLLIKDPNAKVIEYTKNVLLISSLLDPLTIYGLLISHPPSCAEKIFPFQLITKPLEKDLVEKTINYIRQNFNDLKKFYVRCINRNSNINCKTIEIAIGIGLKNFWQVDFKNPEIIIYVNALKDFCGISFLRKGQEKFRLTLSNKI
ncbi:RNA methyltransferase [Sulfolobus sp. A20]|uniref:THUMP domain-containing protein n=1 Tax=Sulfolobaceae TaxID=118883 RepID=UPI000845CBDC|nr:MULTISPECIES: THUMP domain-containing protein [unclassified Sulfolobus]TRM78294.1 RNA methyltransferase [Sulfolobus sp. A20-N-F8]TRM81718.1 RNA methyltransferase [Sulfolobus sp. D5]TRM84185.1 RNA methyltransferase [Sulfolobus sp. F3]TRM88061.1 RNA methyltransferase [Sulfolobus sp. C3]TRM99678.1 RNA methyltransferase [Sulfolobus sp. E1]TRN01170.1 RNA methyltransferase [Sulfolobus sp. F1]